MFNKFSDWKAEQLEEKKKLFKEASQEQSQKIFKDLMQKYGVSSPAEFKDDATKKKFFDEFDSLVKADNESLTLTMFSNPKKKGMKKEESVTSTMFTVPKKKGMKKEDK